MNGLPRFLPDLLATIGVLYFDDWPSEASSHAMNLFKATKAKEDSGQWILSDVQNLITVICSAENEVIEKHVTSNIDYWRILGEMRPCSLENIREFWQVRYLMENEPKVFKGAKRFYKKLCSGHTEDQAKEGMKLKLIEILATAEAQYSSSKNSAESLRLDPQKLLMFVYHNFRSIASRGRARNLSIAQDKTPRIGLGIQSSYKRNDLDKEVKVDARTQSKASAFGHRLYTPGWSADGHFADDKE